MALDLASLDDRPTVGVLAASSVGRGPQLLGRRDTTPSAERLGQVQLPLVAAAEIGVRATRLAGMGLWPSPFASRTHPRDAASVRPM